MGTPQSPSFGSRVSPCSLWRNSDSDIFTELEDHSYQLKAEKGYLIIINEYIFVSKQSSELLIEEYEHLKWITKKTISV